MISYGKTSLRMLGAALGALPLLSSPAEAGSIFMKNGYIIQGPIVERNDAQLVLRYASGRVTIHRRFIDSVSYDTDEEQKLQEREAYLAELQRGESTRLELTPAEYEIEDLPSSLEKLMDEFFDKGSKTPNATPLDGTPPGSQPWDGVPTEGAAGTTSTPTLPVEVRTVTPADTLILEEQPFVSSALRVSFQAPVGWSVQTGKEFVLISEAPATVLPGTLPLRVNVVSFADPQLAVAECLKWLKQEVAEELSGFEAREEGEVALGDARALQVIGAGAWQGGEKAYVRQLLVEKSGRFWLVSAFASEAREGEVTPMLEKIFATFRFSTDS